MNNYEPTLEEFSQAYQTFHPTMMKVYERMQEHHQINCNVFIELISMFAAELASTAPYEVEMAILFVKHFQVYFESYMRVKIEQLASEGAND